MKPINFNQFTDHKRIEFSLIQFIASKIAIVHVQMQSIIICRNRNLISNLI